MTREGPPAHQAVLGAPAPWKRLLRSSELQQGVLSAPAMPGQALTFQSFHREGLTSMGPSSVSPRHLRALTIRGILLGGL